MKKQLLLTLLCSLLSITAWGQQRAAIKGQVTDESGSGIVGALVVENGTSNATSTGTDGAYTINVTPGASITFSSLGYTPQTVQIGSQRVVNVTLMEDMQLIDDVVVVGYGTQKKATLTGAVSQISGEDILSTKSANTVSSIQGKVPGLMIRQTSGAPGSDAFMINIRGNDAAPLLVVDGVARPEMSLNGINPNDIESFSVLKDASAAIYGINAANGVIIVTTKKATVGRTRVSYSGYYGVRTPTGLRETVDAYTYRLMQNEMSRNWDGTSKYTQSELDKWKEGTEPGYQDYNWMQEMLRKFNHEQQHGISITGGNDKISYYLSGGYMDESGLLSSKIMKNSKYDYRANISAELFKGFRADATFSGQFKKTVGPQFDFIWLYKQILFADRGFGPTALGYPDRVADVEGTELNPYAYADKDINGYAQNKNNTYQSTLNLTYDLPWVQGLQLKFVGALDSYQNNASRLEKQFDIYNYSTGDFVKKSANMTNYENQYNISKILTMQAQISYARKFNDAHNVSGTLVWEAKRGDGDYLKAATKYPDIFIGDWIDLGSDDETTAAGNRGRNRQLSLIGRFNYNYKERYMAEVAFRYDGTYQFNYGDRWIFAPSVSLGWRMSEENFIKKNARWISNLKLRGSYGIVGEIQSGQFEWFEGYGALASGMGYVFNDGSLTQGLSYPKIVNPDLTWAKNYTANVGFDLSLWNDKLFMAFDLFQKDRKGEVNRRISSTPNIFGGEMPFENLNATRIKGIEMEIGHANKTGDFSYRIAVNATYSRKQLVKVERAPYNSSMERWTDEWAEGRYYGVRWGFNHTGQYTDITQLETAPLIDRTGAYGNSKGLPGTGIIYDANGDGRIDEADKTHLFWNGQTAYGETNPPLQYGMTFDFRWKNLDLNMVLQGSAFYTLYSSNWDVWGYVNDGKTLYTTYMDRWHTADPAADPRDPNTKWVAGYWNALSTSAKGTTDDLPTQRYLMDASYLRLKSIELGYTLPSKWTKTLSIEHVRVYFNAYNLLTFCNKLVRDFDPEKAEGPYQANLSYPLMKSFNFGINISF